MFKKIASLLLILSLSLTFTGCSSNSDSSKNSGESGSETIEFTPSETPKEFSNESFSITLADNYKETESDDYTCQFTSNESICFVLCEAVKDIEAAGYTFETIEDYRDATLEKSGITYEETKEYSGSETNTTQSDTEVNSCLSTWTKIINETEYTYRAYFHKTNNSYWTIQFVCHSDLFPLLEEHYNKYYNSAVFIK